MCTLSITLHDVPPEDLAPVTRWLEEILLTHEAIGDYTVTETPCDNPDPLR